MRHATVVLSACASACTAQQVRTPDGVSCAARASHRTDLSSATLFLSLVAPVQVAWTQTARFHDGSLSLLKEMSR